MDVYMEPNDAITVIVTLEKRDYEWVYTLLTIEVNTKIIY